MEPKASRISDFFAIWGSLTRPSPSLSDYMFGAFEWRQATDEYPDMTAEEIASMAADGFEVADG